MSSIRDCSIVSYTEEKTHRRHCTDTMGEKGVIDDVLLFWVTCFQISSPHAPPVLLVVHSLPAQRQHHLSFFSLNFGSHSLFVLLIFCLRASFISLKEEL